MRKSVAAVLSTALTFGALLGATLFGAPAHADSLATTDRAEAVEQAEAQGWHRGSSKFHGLLWFDEFYGATDEVFPTAQSLGVCEQGYGRFAALLAGPLNGDSADFGFLASIQSRGGYDQGRSLTIEGTRTLDSALGGDAANGVYEVRLACLNSSGEFGERYFAAKVLVNRGQWIYAGPVRK